jgi:hypothetical protein
LLSHRQVVISGELLTRFDEQRLTVIELVARYDASRDSQEMLLDSFMLGFLFQVHS